MIRDYKDLIVWQKSMDVCEMVYRLLTGFPQYEMYGLADQIRRSAVSIPSNIAEGNGRSKITKEYKQFLHIAYGSSLELETQLLLAQRLKYIDRSELDAVMNELVEIMKILNSLLRKMC